MTDLMDVFTCEACGGKLSGTFLCGPCRREEQYMSLMEYVKSLASQLTETEQALAAMEKRAKAAEAKLAAGGGQRIPLGRPSVQSS
jgi:hypothetical protein